MLHSPVACKIWVYCSTGIYQRMIALLLFLFLSGSIRNQLCLEKTPCLPSGHWFLAIVIDIPALIPAHIVLLKRSLDISAISLINIFIWWLCISSKQFKQCYRFFNSIICWICSLSAKMSKAGYCQILYTLYILFNECLWIPFIILHGNGIMIYDICRCINSNYRHYDT